MSASSLEKKTKLGGNLQHPALPQISSKKPGAAQQVGLQLPEKLEDIDD